MTGRHRRFTLPLIFLFLPSIAAAQDDYRFADKLAQGGWFDLATDLSTKLPPADGKYLRARIKTLQAERLDGLEAQIKSYDDAIRELEDVLKNHADSPRAADALGEIAFTHQSAGKLKIQAGQMDSAVASFRKATQLFLDLIESLKKTEPAPGTPAHEAWEEKEIDAHVNYVISLFVHAEAYRGLPDAREAMQKVVSELTTFYENIFAWKYSGPVDSDACIYVGRGYQLLAEAEGSSPAAQDLWRKALKLLSTARSTIVADRENLPKYEYLRDIAARATFYEMKARLSHGATLRGSDATSEYRVAAKAAEDLFEVLPSARQGNLGKGIQVEQGRALSRAGDAARARPLLEKLIRENKDTWIEDQCRDILAEFGGSSPRDLVEAADNLRTRGETYLPKAIKSYQMALATLTPADTALAARSWFGIGFCYFWMDRFYEADAALDRFKEPAFKATPELKEAAPLKLKALKRIADLTGSAEAKKAYDDFQRWIGEQPELRESMGDAGIRDIALGLEAEARKFVESKSHEKAAQSYEQAIKKWQELKPTSAYYEEALFSTAYDQYLRMQTLANSLKNPDLVQKQKDEISSAARKSADEALQGFARHLAHIRSSPPKAEASVTTRSVGSVLFTQKTLLSPILGPLDDARATKILEISETTEKDFPKADPTHLMTILYNREQALLHLKKTADAEAAFLTIEAKMRKHQLGINIYQAALGAIAEGFRAAADAVRGADPEAFATLDRKAEDYYFRYTQETGGTVNRDDPLSVADSRYKRAETDWDRAKSDEERAAARKTYGEAHALYADLLASKDKLAKSSEADIRDVELRAAKCQLRTGNFNGAILKIQELLAKDEKNGRARELLADAYYEQSLTQAGADRAQTLEKARKEYFTLFARFRGADNEHFYRLTWKSARVLLELGDMDALAGFFRPLEVGGYAPEWDKGPFKPLIEAIRSRVSGSLPPRKEGK